MSDKALHIVGVDRSSPGIEKLIARFEKRAVGPERVADRILEGVEKGRYMVFTSADIRIAYWFQRKFALPYEIAMRKLNDRLTAAAGDG
ncbi:MAG: hypothetical protein WD810_03560 [Solirubrobacterales bacterium]